MMIQNKPLYAVPFPVSKRKRSAGKRRGMILCDLLFASALALSAALVLAESASMLARMNSFAINCRADAYALADLIEAVGGEAKDGFVPGRMGWRAEISSLGAANDGVSLKTVVITRGSDDEAVSFEWTLCVKGEE